ncbi:MAG: IS4 family transposase [Saprospiraceae bacterium]
MQFSVPECKFIDISKRMETIFRKEQLNDLGRELGFIHRQRIVSGLGFAQLCIGGAEESGLNASLTQLLTQARKLGMALSPEGLNSRFTAQAESFMEKLFAKVAAWHIEEELELNTLDAFSEVLVEDSSNWQLPACLKARFKGFGGGASEAGIKLNLRIGLKSANWQVCFRNATAPDNTSPMGSISAHSLLLRDLGYFKIDDLRSIEKSEAFYVSRFKFNTTVYLSADLTEKPIDLLTISRKMKVNEVRQIWCYIGRAQRFRTRLVLQKVPVKVAQTKRKKLKEDKQNKRKNLSQDRLQFCDLNAFITNLPQNSFCAQQVMKLYTIRWMIEIIFKVWKSVYRIDEMRPMNEYRFMCLLYGKLIWILLHHKLFSWTKCYFWNTYHIDVSELKGFKILQELKTDLQQALWNNSFQACFEFLNVLYQLIGNTAQKQVRRRKFNQLLHFDKLNPPQHIANQILKPCPALS